MSDLSKSSLITVSKEVVSCDLAGEVAMLDMKDGVYYGLDPVGATIWNAIQKPATVQEVLDTLLEEYEVEEDEAYTDLLELLEELLEKKLIAVE